MYELLWLKTEQWELIYYLAFILLTIGIVFFTAKTYWFQSKKVSELFCKCVDTPTARGNRNVCIEIYNYGNAISKDIKVKIQETDFGVIPFLKPNESYVIPFAYFIYAGDHKILQSNNVEIKSNDINVQLDINEKIYNYDIDITIIKFITKLPETDFKSQDKLIAELGTVAKNQEKTTAEIKKVADAISKIKK